LENSTPFRSVKVQVRRFAESVYPVASHGTVPCPFAATAYRVWKICSSAQMLGLSTATVGSRVSMSAILANTK
jgi:hypothetical protein